MTVRAMKAGAVEFLTKPFRDQDLLDAIQQAIAPDRVGRHQRAELAGSTSRSPPNWAPAKSPLRRTAVRSCARCGLCPSRLSSGWPNAWAYPPPGISPPIPTYNSVPAAQTVSFPKTTRSPGAPTRRVARPPHAVALDGDATGRDRVRQPG